MITFIVDRGLDKEAVIEVRIGLIILYNLPKFCSFQPLVKDKNKGGMGVTLLEYQGQLDIQVTEIVLR